MKIHNFDRIALIIVKGDIGNNLSEYLKSISPQLVVIPCGRGLSNKDLIFLDLSDYDSF